MNCRAEHAFRQGEANLDLAKKVADSMVHPSQSAIDAGWTNGRTGIYSEPWDFGNKSLYPYWNPTGQGPGCSQYLDIWPDDTDTDPAYILSYCQVAYAKATTP